MQTYCIQFTCAPNTSNMDFVVFSVLIITVLSFTTVSASLRCIECTHMEADESHRFEGSDSVYYLFRSKFNKACTFENPNDRNLYNQWLANYQQQQQQQPQFGQTQMINPKYDISETICPVIGRGINKCRFLNGTAEVYLPTYKNTVTVQVAVRDCIQQDDSVQDVCYIRDTDLGYFEIRVDLNIKFAFVSSDASLQRFVGRECYCSSDRCLQDISGSTNLIPSIHLLLLAALMTYLVHRRL